MSGRRIALAAAAVLILAASVPEPAAAKNPWDYVKDWWGEKSPFKKKVRVPRTAQKPDKADKTKDELAAAPLQASIPIPRPRPRRSGEAGQPRDFDAAFVPPPVLRIPPDPELAPGEVPPPDASPPAVVATATPAQPEVIPLGPPGVGEKSSAAFPFPQPRPKPQGPQVEPLAMLPVEPPPPPIEKPSQAEISKCMTSLASLGVDASPLAMISEGACGVAMPASVTSFENGVVKLPVKALISCQLAETAAHWLHDTVQPAALTELNGPVNGLRIAASYDCRTRDHLPGEKLSEHAFGNALDLSAFRVNGRWIEVGGGHDDRATAFLNRIRSEACGPFKTVLGPGSDGYHSDHLHLDMAKRQTAGPSKGLYCK